MHHIGSAHGSCMAAGINLVTIDDVLEYMPRFCIDDELLIHAICFQVLEIVNDKQVRRLREGLPSEDMGTVGKQQHRTSDGHSQSGLFQRFFKGMAEKV